MEVSAMPTGRNTSASYPGPRSDLESHGFAPEFVPTAAEQRLMLFTHIVRAFGITIALMINAILFVPFFIFGIAPALIKKRFGSNPVYPPLAPKVSTKETQVSQDGFLDRDHHRTKRPNGDVSPLLLSAGSSISDLGRNGERAAIFRDAKEDSPFLPGPIIDFPCIIGGYATYGGPTIQVTQPPTPSASSSSGRSLRGSAKSDDGTEDKAEDEGLVMKNNNNTHSVDLLMGTPKFGSGHASGLNIPGHGQHGAGNMVMKREKTWENLQEAVYPASKLL